MSDAYSAGFTEQNPFTRRCGCVLHACTFERASATLVIDPALHHNGAHVVHGGVYLTLADFVCSAAANCRGELRLSSGGSYAFLKSAVSGTLTATATLVSASKNLCYHRAEITDENGELLFTATMQAALCAPSLPKNIHET